MLLWASLCLYVLLVNYPVPPQAHHVDKCLLICLFLLIWVAWLELHPQSLGRTLGGRAYMWATVVGINMLVFILAGELVMRLADPVLARSGLFGDKHTPANLKAHAEVRGSIGRTNTQGFRDRERVFARDRDAPRVVAVGDSFTWGAGVDYDASFVTLLERALQDTEPRAEVFNLGVPMWRPHEELHLLRTFGIRDSPDLVIFNVFLGDDIQNQRGQDIHIPKIMIVAGQSYDVHSNGNWVHDIVAPDRWYLYHNINYLIRVGIQCVLSSTRPPPSMMDGEWVPLLSREHFLRGIRKRTDVYLEKQTSFFQTHWSRTKTTLREAREFLDARGVAMLLVLIPELIPLDPVLQEEYFATYGGSDREYDFRKPQRLLREWCAETGTAVIDLTPPFAAAANPERLYFSNDIHWTSDGHRLAAKVILPALQAELAGHRRHKRLANPTTDGSPLFPAES